jgi:hypothetical protein
MRHDYTLVEESFAHPDRRLHELTHVLIRTADLPEYFRAHPERKADLENRGQQTLFDAFVAHQPEARSSVHQTLLALFDMHFYPPDKKPVFNQFEPTLSELRQRLETGWLHYEQSRIPPFQLPPEPHAFIDWLEERVLTHELASHPLFPYLEEHASFREMADYFYQESTIDARLDDLLVLGQVGMPDRVKLEIGENFWSELGHGDPTMIHTTLFHTLLEAFGVQNQNALATLLPEALACGNLLLLTALHRQYAYVQHGVLATMELMAPARFERIARGGRRLGLPEPALRYLDLHSTLDIQHGNGWRDNVLLPTVETNVAARDDMVKGVFYRLNTSQDYCDALYRRYCRGSLE